MLLGLILFFALLAVLITGYQLIYLGRIFPGVKAAGVDVGGLSPSAAAALISEKATYPQTGKVIFLDGQKTWSYPPLGLGLFLDAEASARAAYRVGRSGGPFARLDAQIGSVYSGKALAPILVWDERMAQGQLTAIAREIDRPVIEPDVNLNGTEVVITQGQVGRTLDVPATLAALREPLQQLRDAAIPLVISESRPVIADVSAQAEIARQILSEPLVLTMPEGQDDPHGPWTLSPDVLASMLDFERANDGNQAVFRVGLRRALVYATLSDIAPEILREAQNARFIFNDDTHQLDVEEASVTGRRLDIEKTADTIQQQLTSSGSHEVRLELALTEPAVTDQMTAEDLGISELLHAETSYFYGSSSDRVHNIQAAAARFHGLLIAPGETFSMATALGDISLENGYAEAAIILGGQTIKGVGGGVCQVSTTLFRTAFFAGLPVVERHAHAYRVYYYEKVAGNRVEPSLSGLDATVFVPLVDFKFVNDTPGWLLMETYVNPSYSSIQWKFYGTPDGRTVDWRTTGPINIVEAPKPLYRENTDLSSGEVKQVDWAADGADVSVNRTVYKDNAVHLQDSFDTNYQPWQAVYEYGPGTEGMPPPEGEGE